MSVGSEWPVILLVVAGKYFHVTTFVVPRQVGFGQNTARTGIQMEAFVVVSPNGHRQIQMPQTTIRKRHPTKPTPALCPLQQPRLHVGNRATDVARRIHQMTAMGNSKYLRRSPLGLPAGRKAWGS